MIHLQNNIKDVLENLLKDSTDDLDLRVSLYNAVLPSDFAFRQEGDNSYEVQLAKYINAVIGSVNGSWIEVPGVNIMNADVIMNVQVPTMEWHAEPGALPIEEVLTNDATEKVFKMFDTFRRKYSSIPIPVGDRVWQLLDESELYLTPPISIDEVREIEFSARFIDGEYKEMVTAGEFLISKENGVLTISYDTNELFTMNYDDDKYYKINITNDNGELGVTVNDGDTQFIQGSYVIDSSITIKEFGGYIEYLGINEQVSSDGSFSEVLIENFDTLENNVEVSEYSFEKGTVIEGTETLSWGPEYRYGANAFGKQGIMTFGITTPDPVTQQYTFGEQSCLYQQLEVILGVTYSEDIFAGNHYRYFIEGEEVSPFSMSHSFAPEPESNQMINANTSKTVNRTNTIGHSLTLYHGVDYKVNKIIRQALRNENEQNDEIVLTLQYPNFKEVYSLVNSQLGTSPVINSMATVSFDLQPRHKF